MVKLDKRIKRMKPDYFRFTLTRDDLVDEKTSGSLLQVLSSKDSSVIEYAILLDGYIAYPYIHYSKYHKIHSDEYNDLKELACSYLFLNPGIGTGGLNKMADFISRHHLKYIKEVPSFSFEEVLQACTDMNAEYPYSPPITERPKMLLFQPNSKLSSDDKRKYTNFARGNHIKSLWEEIIYVSADHAISNTKPYIIVSRNHVMKSSNVLADDKKIVKPITSNGIYHKYINDKTKKLLAKDSEKRFIHEGSEQKLNQFLELDPSLSSRKISKELGVSLSTVAEFRRIRDVR